MKPTWLSCSLLLTTALLNAAQTPYGPFGWVPFESIPNVRQVPRQSRVAVDPNVAQYIDPNMGLVVNFDNYGMTAREVAQRGEEVFHGLSIPMSGTLRAVGRPELPVVGQVVEVPLDAKIRVELIRSESISIGRYVGRYNVYPAQPSRARQEGGEEEPFVKDPNVYGTDANYPGQVVAQIEPDDVGIIRGHRVVFLRIYPVQYNPVTGKATAYPHVKVLLTYDRPDPNEPVNPRIVSEPFEKLLAGAALNYRHPEPRVRAKTQATVHALSNGTTPGCDYLIISPRKFYDPNDPNNPLVRLGQWKQRKGYYTQVAVLERTPGLTHTADSIRHYLQQAYQTWSPPPTYVLLVGDTADDNSEVLVPTNYGLYEKTYRTEVGTDLYYATVDGNDYFPDLYVGRLSVDTMAQADAVIRKIMDYEQASPELPQYYARVPLIQLFEDDEFVDGQEDTGFRIVKFAEILYSYLKGARYDPNRIYSRSGHFPNGPQKYSDGTDVPTDLKFYRFLWAGCTDDIRRALEDGSFLVVYNGHGSSRGWEMPAFDTSNVKPLGNGRNTPVVLSIACNTGWFDNETDGLQDTTCKDECFCEELLRRSPGGAVAVVGSSRLSFEDNDFLLLGMFSAIWPNLSSALDAPHVPLPSSPPNVPLDRMGQINTYAKFFMKDRFAASTRTRLHFELYNLFGDPEMPLWTREPHDLQVASAGTGARGLEPFTLYVTDPADSDRRVADALVVLTGDDPNRILGRRTGNDGCVTFSPEEIQGFKYVTVTARNHRPYQSPLAQKTDAREDVILGLFHASDVAR